MNAERAVIDAIYRYPVKGLSPQRLPATTLSRGATLPHDRLYAIENGPSGFDPAAPAYMPKTCFLMLMRNEQLASLRTDYDEPTHTLTIAHDGREAARGDLRTRQGRLEIEAFFRRFMPKALRGPPKVLSGQNHSFSDVSKKVVSIINLASVAELEAVAGAPVDPLRFRANLYVRGWHAWEEFKLVGERLQIGDTTLKVTKRIVRCAATEVDPATGIRDLPIPKTLLQNFDHMDCGVYAEVLSGAAISEGDRIETTSDRAPRLDLF